MPAFTHRTVVADVRYQLRNRGRWHYDFWYDGQRHRDSTHTKDIKQARNVTEKAIERLLNAERIGVKSLPISEAVELYLTAR